VYFPSQPLVSHLSSWPVSILGTKTCYSLSLLSTTSSRYQVIMAWISQPQDPAAAVVTRNLTPWSPVTGQRSAVSRTWTWTFRHVRCVCVLAAWSAVCVVWPSVSCCNHCDAVTRLPCRWFLCFRRLTTTNNDNDDDDASQSLTRPVSSSSQKNEFKNTSHASS